MPCGCRPRAGSSSDHLGSYQRPRPPKVHKRPAAGQPAHNTQARPGPGPDQGQGHKGVSIAAPARLVCPYKRRHPNEGAVFWAVLVPLLGMGLGLYCNCPNSAVLVPLLSRRLPIELHCLNRTVLVPLLGNTLRGACAGPKGAVASRGLH